MGLLEENSKIAVVVDDNEGNLRCVEALLRTLGYQVVLTDKVEEARVELKKRAPVDVILMDVRLSRADGFGIVKQLKSDEITKTIPIIMMASHAETEDSLDALAAGADEILTTPINKAELQARVKSLVKVKAYNDHILGYQQDMEREVARRTQELMKALEKIKVSSLDTVYRLSIAGEYKDEGTGAHVQRVSHYSSAIARKLGLEEKFVENILWAAPMHDIGKIGIPDRILLKPGRFDDEERAIMEQHTVIGAQILKDSEADFIKLAADVAISHHEKWTGGGYPHGVTGENIPLCGRIVSVADVFDALTSERPYKAAFPVEKAMAMIKEGQEKGQFDPRVVEAFLAIEDEIRAEHSFWSFMSSSPAGEESDLSNLFK